MAVVPKLSSANASQAAGPSRSFAGPTRASQSTNASPVEQIAGLFALVNEGDVARHVARDEGHSSSRDTAGDHPPRRDPGGFLDQVFSTPSASFAALIEQRDVRQTPGPLDPDSQSAQLFAGLPAKRAIALYDQRIALATVLDPPVARGSNLSLRL